MTNFDPATARAEIDRLTVSFFLESTRGLTEREYFVLAVPCPASTLLQAVLSYAATDREVAELDGCRIVASAARPVGETVLSTTVEVAIHGIRPPLMERLEAIRIKVKRHEDDRCFLAATWGKANPRFARGYLEGLLLDITRRWPEVMKQIEADMSRASDSRGTASTARADEADRPRAGTSPQPRVPGRTPEFRTWVQTWRAIERPWKDRKYLGTNRPMKGAYSHLLKWLKANKPELACSPETLADIIKAGEAGLLEHMPEMPN